jgi:ribosome-associated translation inhibitor RaiA
MEKLQLSGFDISEAEKSVINNIIQNYEAKIARELDYNQLSLRLKKSQHGKTFLHEIETKLETDGKRFNAKVIDYNLFYAVSEALEKIINEIKHYNKKK